VSDATAEELLIARVPSLAEDILLALRFFYYVKARPLVPDPHYDQAEREYMNRDTTNAFDNPLNEPGSDNADDYPDRVKALALYMALAQEDALARLAKTKGKTG